MVRVILALTLLAGAGAAQIVAPALEAFTGTIHPIVGTQQVCDTPTHALDCNGLFVQSSVLDLSAFEGAKFKFFGSRNICGTFEVTSIESPENELLLCGTPAIGCQFRLRSAFGGPSAHVLLVSLDASYLPVSPIKGSLLLAEPFLVLAELAGNVDPAGAAFDFALPADPSLIGLDVYMQAARRNIGPIGPFSLSNAVCFTTLPPLVFCAQPDC